MSEYDDDVRRRYRPDDGLPDLDTVAEQVINELLEIRVLRRWQKLMAVIEAAGSLSPDIRGRLAAALRELRKQLTGFITELDELQRRPLLLDNEGRLLLLPKRSYGLNTWDLERAEKRVARQLIRRGRRAPLVRAPGTGDGRRCPRATAGAATDPEAAGAMNKRTTRPRRARTGRSWSLPVQFGPRWRPGGLGRDRGPHSERALSSILE
jgi:hypothetical protein